MKPRSGMKGPPSNKKEGSKQSGGPHGKPTMTDTIGKARDVASQMGGNSIEKKIKKK